MRSVKIATLKDELSSHLRAVERGASFVVTDRDRPVAQLVPIATDEGFDLIPATKPFKPVRFRRTRHVIDSLALLMKERGER